MTPIGRIGTFICYDGWFPESFRPCALQGADIICIPTNWVPIPGQAAGREAMASILVMAGAHSNSVFVAAADRVGIERGRPFVGQSLVSDGALPGGLEDEADLEQRFVIPTAMRVAARHPDVFMLSHPFGNKRRRTPDCETAAHKAGRVVDCPKCWRTSKSWASVAAFGTHHNFDVVARTQGRRLAVEIKLVGARGGHMPNGEVQRFLGQCALASAKHGAIGICACFGPFDAGWHRDCAKVTDWFARRGVSLVCRAIDGGPVCSHGDRPSARANSSYAHPTAMSPDSCPNA